jgi:hypothetical protein
MTAPVYNPGGELGQWTNPVTGAPIPTPTMPEEAGLQGVDTATQAVVGYVSSGVSKVTGSLAASLKKWGLIALVSVAALVLVFFALRAAGQRIGS